MASAISIDGGNMIMILTTVLLASMIRDVEVIYSDISKIDDIARSPDNLLFISIWGISPSPMVVDPLFITRVLRATEICGLTSLR